MDLGFGIWDLGFGGLDARSRAPEGAFYSPKSHIPNPFQRCLFDPANRLNPGKVLPTGKGCIEIRQPALGPGSGMY